VPRWYYNKNAPLPQAAASGILEVMSGEFLILGVEGETEAGPRVECWVASRVSVDDPGVVPPSTLGGLNKCFPGVWPQPTAKHTHHSDE
jgi:hypothetical protein